MYWDKSMLTKPLTFVYRSVQDEGCYVIPDAKERKLFWIDWYKNYFAEKFKNQKYITNIETVDLERAVVINAKTQQLDLPPNLKAIIHLATVKDPLQFNTKINATMVLVVSILAIIVVCLLQRYHIIPVTKLI